MKRLLLFLLLIISLTLTSCSKNVPYVGDNGNWWIDEEDTGVAAQGPQGEPGVPGEDGVKGDTGARGYSVKVLDVSKTSSKGSVDTYTITFSDGTTGTFTVTNGKDGKDGEAVTIKNVAKISSTGLVDTYRISFSDGSSHVFKVTNGKDGASITILSIKKTSTDGAVDTYSIAFSDGTETSFTVTNGKDGETPYIGENGNWWVGDKDTGVFAGHLDKTGNMDRVGTDGLLFRTTIRGGVAGFEVYGYTGTATDIVLPNLIFGKPVVSIAQGALPTSITSLSLSSHTEYLPVFEDYTKLSRVDFNNAPVNELFADAFRDCSALTTLENYGNIKTLGSYAFYNTNLEAFEFTGIKTIGSYAFQNCRVFDLDWRLLHRDHHFVYIPDTVESIAQNAFDSELFVYYAGTTAPSFTSEYFHYAVKTTDDGYYYKDNGLTVSLLNYNGTSSRLTVPATLSGKALTEVEDYAFFGNHIIERVELPSGVTKIGEYTFALCKKLHSLFIPDTIEACGEFDDIYDNASDGYENLTIFFAATSFDYAGGITSPSQLGLVKYMTGIKPAEIVDDSTCVYLKKTLSCEVVTIKNVVGIATIPATYNGLPVSRINTYALYGNTLTRVVDISSGIDKISTNAFYGSSNLRIVNVPASVNMVNHYGFYDLTNCTIHAKAASKPEDWDSSWYYNIDGVVWNSWANYSQDSNYLYEIVDGKVYLTKYLHTVSRGSHVIVPEKVDGKTVYGVRSYCFDLTYTSSSSSRYSFYIPKTITVMESYAIDVPSYSYCNIYLDFNSSSEIPSTWSSYWFYNSGYSYSSSYNNVYYNSKISHTDSDGNGICDACPTIVPKNESTTTEEE